MVLRENCCNPAAMVRFALRDPTPPLSLADWRALARRKLPDLAWHYIDGGADDHVALHGNRAAFGQWHLRQRALAGVMEPDLRTRMAGTEVSLPVALAPCGAAGLAHWSGDSAAARAAEAAGTRLTLSTAASYTLEEVAEATEANHWFQLYPFADRTRVGAFIDRARDAGYSALFVTVDVPMLGNREGERRHGSARPWTLTPRRLFDLACHPRWLAGTMQHRRIAARHYLEMGTGGGTVMEQFRRAVLAAGDDATRSAIAQERLMQADLDWDDLKWMRERWPGPLYVKGVLDPEDAARAVDEVGCEGVVVSNHGGRQLDRALPAIDALPAVVDRIGGRGAVYCDSGFRRGSDVVTALALGADGVFVGRPWLYGLAGGGEVGVRMVIETLRSEISRTLILMGCPNVASLDRSWLIPRERYSAGTASSTRP